MHKYFVKMRNTVMALFVCNFLTIMSTMHAMRPRTTMLKNTSITRHYLPHLLKSRSMSSQNSSETNSRDYDLQIEHIDALIKKEKIKLNVINPLIVSTKIIATNSLAMPTGLFVGAALGTAPALGTLMCCGLLGVEDSSLPRMILEACGGLGCFSAGIIVATSFLSENSVVRQMLKEKISKLGQVRKYLETNNKAQKHH